MYIVASSMQLLFNYCMNISHNTVGAKRRYQRPRQPKMKSPFTVELKPMEIRTFNITVEYTVF